MATTLLPKMGKMLCSSAKFDSDGVMFSKNREQSLNQSIVPFTLDRKIFTPFYVREISYRYLLDNYTKHVNVIALGRRRLMLHRYTRIEPELFIIRDGMVGVRRLTTHDHVCVVGQGTVSIGLSQN